MKLERLTDAQISERLENEWDGLDGHGIAVFAVLEQRQADQKALDQAVEEARREERERIEKLLILEHCEPGTGAFYDDYYWIDKHSWQSLKNEVKEKEVSQLDGTPYDQTYEAVANDAQDKALEWFKGRLTSPEVVEMVATWFEENTDTIHLMNEPQRTYLEDAASLLAKIGEGVK